MARFAVPYVGPPRGYDDRGMKKIYIAIHNTSNSASVQAEANYAKTRSDKTSSHFYADNKSVIQSLDTSLDANHAGSRSGNGKAVAFELVGTNGSSRDHWVAVINKVAPVIAAVMKYHGIANRHLSVSQAKAGALSGIVTHNDMRLAWGGTTHDDPGPNFPMDYLIAQVGKYLNPAVPAKPVPPRPPVVVPPVPATDWFDGFVATLPTVKKGDKGRKVNVIQGLLCGNDVTVKCDGDFGSGTEAATKQFQHGNSLPQTGVWDTATWKAAILP